jgi:hypothetical protein
MKDVFAALYGPRDPLGVANVARNNLRRTADIRRHIGEPADAVPRVVVDQRADLRALRNQHLDQMAADETVRAGDEHALS